MTSDHFVKEWRTNYDAARGNRNACVAGWLVSSLVIVFLLTQSDPFLQRCAVWLPVFFGGVTLALLGHYQANMETLYSALKGTRDEPPLDELSARRRR